MSRRSKRIKELTETLRYIGEITNRERLIIINDSPLIYNGQRLDAIQVLIEKELKK